MRSLALILVGFTLSAQTAKESPAKLYEDDEAYDVYAALASSPSPGIKSSDQAVMTQRTLVFKNCYQPDEQWRDLLSPAVTNYNEINQTRWDLVDSKIHFPHKVVSADEMHAFFSEGPRQGWKKFHLKYPHKTLWSVSAVGFNPDRTVAIVATESLCGPLCGSGTMSLLRKSDGVWKRVQPGGTICIVNY